MNSWSCWSTRSTAPARRVRPRADGWIAWLRPNAKKSSRDHRRDSTEMTAADFIAQITPKSPHSHGRSAPFTFHSIIGIGEKPQPTGLQPTEAAQTTPALQADTVGIRARVSRAESRHRGLRFPILSVYGLRRGVREDRRRTWSVTRPSRASSRFRTAQRADLDLSKVAVSYYAGDGTGRRRSASLTAAECVPDAFYIDAATRRSNCVPRRAGSQSGPNPKIDVLLRASRRSSNRRLEALGPARPSAAQMMLRSISSVYRLVSEHCRRLALRSCA